MKLRRRSLAASLPLVALCACGGSGATPFRATVRDSAGIHITENRGLAALPPAPWRVDPARVLDLGGAETDGSAPYQITGAVRLSDGRVAVASNGSGEILVYAPDGRLYRRAGRRGDGPGEFRSIFALGLLPGDSLAAWDPLAGRASVFAPDGSFAYATTPHTPGVLSRAMGWTAAGELVLGVSQGGVPPASRVPTVTRDSLEILIIGRDGAVVRSLGRFPGGEMAGLRNAAGGTLVRPLPFGRQTLAVTTRGRIYVTTSDGYEVAEYGARGLERLVRADRNPLPVRARDVDEYRRTLVAMGGEGNAQLRRDEEQMLAQLRYPATMPPIADLATDADGRIWVKEAVRPGHAGPDLWTVFDPDGRGVGTVEVPNGLRITQIGRGWLLGVAVDGDQVEHIRLYGLHAR